jgi:hypothetical protein
MRTCVLDLYAAVPETLAWFVSQTVQLQGIVCVLLFITIPPSFTQ